MADNNGTINFGPGEQGISSKGIGSYLTNQKAKSQFSSQVFAQDTGLIDVTLKKLRDQNKAIQDILKSEEKLSKRQKDNYNEIIKDLDSQELALKHMKETREATYGDITSVLNKSTSAVIKSLKEQKKHLDKNSDSYEEQLEYMNQINKELDQYNEKLKDTDKVLNKSQDNFFKGISESLDSASEGLMNIANMFNINKIANSGLNQFVSTKLDLQNQMMKDFGMTSRTQYTDFKNNMESTLKDMGNLFNYSDLTTYMSNLSKMGITDTRMAEQMARSSMMATKYLGVSNETQEQLFKYMKRTSDYDMLDEHNKTITGILKAQLGVSREQLDLMSQEALSNMDALAAAGVAPEVREKFKNQYITMEASIADTLGDDTAKSIMGVISEIANSTYYDTARLSQKYGENIIDIQRLLHNEGDVESAVKLLASSAAGRGLVSSTDRTANLTIRQAMGIDYNTAAAIDSLFGKNEVMENFTKALEQQELAEPGSFVENTTELTSIDKMANWLDKFLNNIDWENFTAIVSASAAMWGTSQIINGVQFLSKLDFSSLFSKINVSSESLKALGSVGKGLLATGGGVLLGVGAANAISDAIESSYNKTKTTEIEAAENALKGTSLEGNSYAAQSLGTANALKQTNGLGASFSTVTRGLGAYTLGWTRNLATINQDDWAFMQEALAPRKSKMSEEDIQRYLTAWGLLLISAGRQSDVPDFANISKSELTETMKSYGWTKDLMNRTVASFNGTMTYPNKSIKENQTNIDWNKLNLNGIGGGVDLGIGGNYPITMGYLGYKNHYGTDYGTPVNTPLGAAVSGTIVESKDLHGNQAKGYRSYGRYVKLQGDNGLTYLYAHLNNRNVSAGQRVNAGDLIGLSGNTGNVRPLPTAKNPNAGAHLHFEVSQNGKHLNPSGYLTSSVFNVGSATSGAPIANSDASFDNGSIAMSSRPVVQRILPTALSGTGGIGGADLIAGSFDNGINKIISYLDNIRNEQNIQRELISTFSRTNSASAIG